MPTVIDVVQKAMQEHFINLLVQQFRQTLLERKLEDFGVTLGSKAEIDNWTVVVDLIGFPSEVIVPQSEVASDEEAAFTRKKMFENYLTTIEQIPVQKELTIAVSGRLSTEYVLDLHAAKQHLSNHVKWLFHQYHDYLELQEN